jgi:hypothetical protein
VAIGQAAQGFVICKQITIENIRICPSTIKVERHTQSNGLCQKVIIIELAFENIDAILLP